MRCDETAQIQAYFDSELSPADQAAMRIHLQSCAACQAELAELKRLSELVAAAPMVEMSDAAFARLQSNFRHVVSDRGVMRIASWLTAAAAAILVGALLFDHPTTVEVATVNTWQTEAVMPPPEQPSSTGEMVAVAQWMASDLAPGDVDNPDLEH